MARSKAKKLTFNMLAADMGMPNVVTVRYEGAKNAYDIDVKTELSFGEAMGFVDSVVSSCVDVSTGMYEPRMFDFAVKLGTLVYYAGIPAPKTDSEDLSEGENAYNVVYGTNLFEIVMGEINPDQFNALVSAAKSILDYNRECMVAVQTSQINSLIGKMDDVMRDGGKVMDMLSDESIQSKVEELARLAGAINGGSNQAGNITSFPLKGVH